MIITAIEFRELGFICDSQNETLLNSCIKRAEYILNALCRGMLASAMAQSEENAALIKQATAFEAEALLKAKLLEERAELNAGKLTQSSTSNSISKHVSIGDVSYTESNVSENSHKNASDSYFVSQPFNITKTVERLLRAAGCFPCTAAEVVE